MPGVQSRQLVDVDRGLFLVRYASAENAVAPPVIRISPGADAGSDIRFVLHPDEDDAVLRLPGACLVMLAAEPGQLAIDISPSRGSVSVAAKVTIEALSPDIEALSPDMEPRPATAARPRRARRGGGLDLIGHVAGRGDVAFKAGEWLGGPTMPSRIEGLQINWGDKPDDLDIHYGVTSARRLSGSGDLAALGAFVGTRGKALPVVAVAFEMSGAGARRHRFAAEMIFLGAPVMRVSGPRVSATGPTGREPLVGLRLLVEAQPTDRPQRGPARPAPPRAASKRVSVFHATPQGSA